MHGLALFAGIGGLEQGLHHIIPTLRPVIYIEREIPSVSILQTNMLRGIIPSAPIYSNIESFMPIASIFNQEVDFISGGFPCQPHSSAGKQKSTTDERWLWDYISEAIRLCSPSYIFLENVSNLLSQPDATHTIFSTLAQAGFNVEWTTLRASTIGANHHRNRLFIFAYLPSQLSRIQQIIKPPNQNNTNSNCSGYGNETSFFKIDNDRQPTPFQIPRNFPFKFWLSPSPNSYQSRWRKSLKFLRCGQLDSSRLIDRFSPEWFSRPPSQSPLCRMDDGFSTQLHRLRSLGNAVVPVQAAHAFYHLIKEASL